MSARQTWRALIDQTRDAKQGHPADLLPAHQPRKPGTLHRLRAYRPSMPSVVSVCSLLGLFGIWWVVTGLGVVSSHVAPTPPALAATYRDLWVNGYAGTSLLGHLWASLERVLIGFAIGGSLGLVIGLMGGFSRVVSAIVAPVVALLRPIPPIAYLPVLVVILGIGQTSKITLIAMAGFFYMFLTTESSVRSVPQAYLRAARMLGLSRRQIAVSIILRAAVPQVMTGLNVAMVISWATVVAAELISSSKGLGFVAIDASTYYRINVVYAAVILIGLIGALIDFTLRRVERMLDPTSR